MEFRFAPEEEAFRLELRSWLRETVPPEREAAFLLEEEEERYEDSRAFVKKLAQKGWVAPAWPREYGGMDASPALQLIHHEEMVYRRAPIGTIIEVVDCIGPTILRFGTEEQKRQHLPPITAGETVWCQGFSEPGAGSDLASLQCHAARDGDDYVINGEKIWTSKAHRSDWCMLLARTDPSAPRREAMSFFLVDMKTPGLTVQPVMNMAEVHSFNHLFFQDVRVPRSALLGEENRGWQMAAMALDLDRFGLGAAALGLARRSLDDLVGYCREARVNGNNPRYNPSVRHKLAELAVEVEVGRCLVYRAAALQDGWEPGNVAATLCKLYSSEVGARVASTGIEVLGLYGQLRRDSKWARLMGRFRRSHLYASAMLVGGGTSEVLRNIIAMRGLGLPRG